MNAGKLENRLTSHQAAIPITREASAVHGNWTFVVLDLWIFGNCMVLNLSSIVDISRWNGWRVMRLKYHRPASETCGAYKLSLLRAWVAVRQTRLTTSQLSPSFIRTVTVGREISSHPVIPFKTGILVGFNHRSGISPCPEGHDYLIVLQPGGRSIRLD